ncbi:MAG: DUF2499 domain-containing protein [Chloroherpetonaceae bacterium]|nr:DUF2499 domain-containing protein [Chloroherpetonaceae bacterium]
MLLSLPTWFIHISSMTEWLWAITLFYRYGKVIGRRDVSRFGLMMIPHWIGGMCVILFHITGDEVTLLLDLSKVINFLGSLALFFAILKIQEGENPKGQNGETLVFPAMLFFATGLNALVLNITPDLPSTLDSLHAHTHQTMPKMWVEIIFQISSAVYFFFLVALYFKFRKTKPLLSSLSVAGFWFLLVFISVTVVCIYYATKVRGFATLTHDDTLHGFAESFLTISNLMIALGAKKSLDEAKHNSKQKNNRG